MQCLSSAHATIGAAWRWASEQEPLGKYGQRICWDTEMGKKENEIERMLDSVFLAQ
jgi:hypothetical protein